MDHVPPLSHQALLLALAPTNTDSTSHLLLLKFAHTQQDSISLWSLTAMELILKILCMVVCVDSGMPSCLWPMELFSLEKSPRSTLMHSENHVCSYLNVKQQKNKQTYVMV